MTFMNRDKIALLYFGSGMTCRFSALLLLMNAVPFYAAGFFAPAALSFGRFAPYLDRDFFRSATPAVSSTPRTV